MLDDVAARVPPAGHDLPFGPITDDPALAGDEGAADAIEAVTPEPALVAGLEPPATDPLAESVSPLGPESVVPAEVAPPPPPSLAERVAAGLVTAALLLAAAIRFGPVPELAAYCVLFCGLVTLSVTDLRVGLVPRRLLYPWLGLITVALAGTAAANGSWHHFWVAALCGVAVFALFFAVWFVVPRGLGFGDVRLAGVIGLALGWLGPLHVYIGFVAAFVAGALQGVATMLVTRRGRKTRIPFAPALAAGAVVAVLWGGPLITAWVGRGS